MLNRPLTSDDVRMHYDRIARSYGTAEWMMELALADARRDQWEEARGPSVLEVGIGTGASLRHHRSDARVTAIELSPEMMRLAVDRARRMGSSVMLRLGDVQALPFHDRSFDDVVATCVFCCVPDPVRGLRECRRVLKPGGRLILLEHTRSELPLLGAALRALDSFSCKHWGEHLDRDTIANVRAAGFVDIASRDVLLDCVKRIDAAAPAT